MPSPPSTSLPIDPLRACGRPAWWGALLVLVVNDRALKGSSLAPSWFTGKASDFAGLFVVVPLVAFAFRVRTTRSLARVVAAIGALFTLLKTSPMASAFYERALAFMHARNVVDPWDLLALPMLAVSAWFIARAPAPSGGAELRARVGALLALPFCLATSAPPPPPCAPEGASGCTEPMTSPTSNFVGTVDATPLAVRIRSAPATCGALAACALPAFTTDEVRTIPAGENIPLPGAAAGCHTYAIDIGDEYPTVVLLAGPGTERVPRSAAASVPDPRLGRPASPGGVLLSRQANGTLAKAVGNGTVALCVEEPKP